MRKCAYLLNLEYVQLQLQLNCMDQPQPCTKCKKLPEDILMLACSHDLCLDCAADRLAFEMKKKKPANSIVCEICYERTALDAESIAELEKLIPNPKTATKSYAEPRQPYERAERVGQPQRSQLPADRTQEKPYERQAMRDYSHSGVGASNNNSLLLSGISSKKSCGEHPDEEILYFCFDCKCECICPECVIHGKHKDHDVKTLKKSSPIVRAELEKSIDKIDSGIQTLLIRKSEVEKTIRTASQQNAQAKRQIQSAFQQVRAKLQAKEKELLARLDAELADSVEEFQKAIKAIIKRIEDMKGYSSASSEVLKREDMVMINFYAKRWKEMAQESKDLSINVPAPPQSSNDKTLSSILELTDHADRITLATERKK